MSDLSRRDLLKRAAFAGTTVSTGKAPEGETKGK